MYDVAIIGGGPAGSTAGSILKTYNPDLSVAIFEKETFPRDHVGESQLPPISRILDEIGCWDKVEAANFPIKVGATYKWGASPNLWEFYFVRSGKFESKPRPGQYEGQRLQTAFQVDRAVYDKILLDHAQELGCEVFQGVGVSRIGVKDDSVTGLTLSSGETVAARHYMDASGNAAILRKAMGVAVDQPGALRNIAIWDYWENAEWAASIGVGGTMVQVMSIGTGWIWFIPLSPTRTSIGFVCPGEHYKSSGKTPEALYLEALAQEPHISALIKNAQREGKLAATKDWSSLSERMTGENWFLIGETTGFADPILAAGMTLSQSSAREAAYSILELERGEHDPDWLKSHYGTLQSNRIQQHIRFADFWYAANGQFTDLKDYTAKIAEDAGLSLDPDEAFRWLGTGGFVDDLQGQVGMGGFDIGSIKQLTGLFAEKQADWEMNKVNVVQLDLEGVEVSKTAIYDGGRITACKCLMREGRKFPLFGLNDLMFQVLQRHSDIVDVLKALEQFFRSRSVNATPQQALMYAIQPLEILIAEGWAKASFDPSKPRVRLSSPLSGEVIKLRSDQ
ncbi:MAG: tryptophan 7-halogenase [Pelagimonas sp.]|jgi:flavin-dependent dehydrogenase|nr:tryptophan 7-halogenase [Pelagimonas sp.]